MADTADTTKQESIPTPPSSTAGKSEKDSETRYTADELVAGARKLLNRSPLEVSGALATLGRKTHTVDQAREETRKFLRRKVNA